MLLKFGGVCGSSSDEYLRSILYSHPKIQIILFPSFYDSAAAILKDGDRCIDNEAPASLR